jgi:lipocalin
MWVLNRKPTMDPAQVTAVLAKAAQQTGFDVSTVTPTVQQGCTY